MNNNDETEHEELDLNIDEELLLQNVCARMDISNYVRLPSPPRILITSNRQAFPIKPNGEIPTGEVISMDDLNDMFSVKNYIHGLEGKVINVNVADEEKGISLKRVLFPEHNDIWNVGLYIKVKGTGLGIQIFASQVEKTVRSGFKQINIIASGKPYKGYYLWPCLGYQGKVTYAPDAEEFNDTRLHNIPHITDSFGRHTYELCDLTSKPEGLSFWKEYGHGMRMTFDLSPLSVSRARLDRYFNARFKGK